MTAEQQTTVHSQSAPSTALGQALFVAGIGATIICGAKAPIGEETWPTTLPYFLLGGVVAAVGIFLWRKALAIQKAQGTLQGDDAKDPVQLLRDLAAPLQTLRTEAATLETAALVVRVDALLDEFVLPMGESRQQFIDRYGMDKGAELLVTLAFGERMLNRVWSAAADGHLPEAVSSLEESADAFEEAVSLLPAS